jgi:hypothetical protein
LRGGWSSVSRKSARRAVDTFMFFTMEIETGITTVIARSAWKIARVAKTSAVSNSSAVVEYTSSDAKLQIGGQARPSWPMTPCRLR